MKNSMKAIVAAAGIAAMSLSMSATAGGFSTAPCQSCHQLKSDVVGPAWDRVAKKYGSAAALAKVFKEGFPVSKRKVAMSEPKFKAQASTMTGMYTTYIKGHEDEAAKALFAAVKAGHF